MTTTTTFDGWACLRVGTVVYSVTINIDGDPIRGPHAICDHCGALTGIRMGWKWGDEMASIDTDVLALHECPPSPPHAPLPAGSVCATRPCNACLTAKENPCP